MYKRMTAVVLVLCMFASLAACKAKMKEPEETTAEPTVETTTEPTFETGPGVAYNIFEEPRDSEEATQAPDTTETKEEETAVTEAEKENAEDPTEATAPAETVGQQLTEYEKYLNMSGDEQTELINSFDSPVAFFEWLNNAKAEHEILKPDIYIGEDAVIIG